MKIKTFLFATTFAMMAACMMNTSCSKYADEFADSPQGAQTDAAVGVEHVKLNLSAPEATLGDGAAGDAATRAALQADGKSMTDIYIFDYDQTSGKLLQVLHQTNSAEDFAQPDMTLAYGDHTLKVIATRSVSPTLLDADSAAWAAKDNVLTPISDKVPAILTSGKTSDSFGATKDVSVTPGKALAVNIQMERIVAKLVLDVMDAIPADCSNLVMDLDEYRHFSWEDFDVIQPVRNQRTYDMTTYAGGNGVLITYFVLVPLDGYSSDVTFTLGKKGSDKPYSQFTVQNVPFERNKVTTIKGKYYNHQSGVTFSLKAEWDKNGNEIDI